MTHGPNPTSPIFVNKVFLEHNYVLRLSIVCGCFCTTVEELSSCDRDCIGHSV